MQPKHITDLLQFLDEKLTKNNKFKKVGPASYLYADEEDTIFVKVSTESIVIINDGPNVVGGMDIMRNFEPADKEHQEEVFESTLQNILSLF